MNSREEHLSDNCKKSGFVAKKIHRELTRVFIYVILVMPNKLYSAKRSA